MPVLQLAACRGLAWPVSVGCSGSVSAGNDCKQLVYSSVQSGQLTVLFIWWIWWQQNNFDSGLRNTTLENTLAICTVWRNRLKYYSQHYWITDTFTTPIQWITYGVNFDVLWSWCRGRAPLRSKKGFQRPNVNRGKTEMSVYNELPLGQISHFWFTNWPIQMHLRRRNEF